MKGAEDFVKRMGEDEEFSRKVNELKDNKERWSFIAESGYKFTPDELRSACEAVSDIGKQVMDLLDDDVSGMYYQEPCPSKKTPIWDQRRW